MRIKRSDILKAIRTEPLKPDNWIHEDHVTDKPLYNSSCKVCAVGAVLRQCGIPDNEISYRARFGLTGVFCGVSKDGNLEGALEAKLYLNALSIKFERLANRLGAGKRTRKQLADFVKKNFPKQFNVAI